jgi:hypothetical protein
LTILSKWSENISHVSENNSKKPEALLTQLQFVDLFPDVHYR